MSTAQEILVDGSSISGAIQLEVIKVRIKTVYRWSRDIGYLVVSVTGLVKETEIGDLFLAKFLHGVLANKA